MEPSFMTSTLSTDMILIPSKESTITPSTMKRGVVDDMMLLFPRIVVLEAAVPLGPLATFRPGTRPLRAFRMSEARGTQLRPGDTARSADAFPPLYVSIA